ncbi:MULTISPECIES: cytochrome ubiquinol oxidase subunit I [Candidatus Ichthyocystis]|uniref:Cytochrome D ubiquinol oxidase subunit 1 n=1 Tax=Candidatus Ichthyocystis hellenicum TaxID=1561003 RepID=A0A0S4M1W7_9BURK|nr:MULTISPECIES: cytochrome ubiquinol oxidase subunit I [Ichthyocystis]CUT16882.1 Cytochrome D ubiquinol oxidase subunit 1 [Candidatus Ichthyocystis hellenicum]
MDVTAISRAQFAANITFHILFPSITIALAWFTLFFKVRFNCTKERAWDAAYRFWVKVFAITFGMGVVSGITMSFQFGTNWPGFMEKVGNVAGPLLSYEVMTAFFLEATFLGVMIFGIDRVSQRVHTFATFLVAMGTTLSAFWIVSLSSWMHTPDGFSIVNNVVLPTDWYKIIFSPSLPYRFSHVFIASFITTAFFIMGISAYRKLRGDECHSVFLALRSSVVVAAVCVPLQMVVGDLHGLNTLKYQPQKIAAIEGIFHTQRGAPAILLGIPSEDEKTINYEVSIPKLASLYLTHHWDGEVRGLSEFPDHPPVLPIFFSFRIMVGISILMLILSWVALFKTRKGWKYFSNCLANIMVIFTFSGWIAVESGWYTTEIGRQPFLVSGVLKTADAVAKLPTHGEIKLSFILYLVTYGVLLLTYISTIFYIAATEEKKNKAKGDCAHGYL